MYISKIHITSFGLIEDYDIELSPGVNVFEGDNESGKSTLAMFIKFIFYGSGSAKAKDSSLIPDRKKFLNWNTGNASGYVTVETSEASYRIERSLSFSTTPGGRDSYREAVKMIDLSNNSTVFKGEVPGEALLGVPEDMFMNTAFVRQTDNTGKKPDSSASSAIENIMFAADESVNIQKALDKLDAVRRNLLYKNGGGGEIFDLEKENAALVKQLADTQSEVTEIISIEGTLADLASKSGDIERKFERADRLCAVWDIRIKLKNADSLRILEKKFRETSAEISRLELRYKNSGASVPDRDFLKEIRECTRTLEVLENDLDEVKEEAAFREANENAFSQNNSGSDDTDEESKNQILEEAHSHKIRKTTFFGVGLVLLIMGIVTGLAVLFGSIISEQFIYFGVISAVLFVVASLLCFKMSSSEKEELYTIFSDWDVRSVAELEDALERERFISEETDSDYDEESRDSIDKLTELINEKCVYAVSLLKSIGKIRDAEYSDYDVKKLLDELRAAENEITDFCDSYSELSRDIELISEKMEAIHNQNGIIPDDEDELRESLRVLLSDKYISSHEPQDAEAVAALRRERDFSAKAIESLVTRTHELEKRLAGLKATVKDDPAVLANRIESNKKKLEDMKKTCDAYQMAYNILSESGDGLRGSVAPKLTEYACRLMAGLSGDRYGAVKDGDEKRAGGIAIDGKLDMTFDADGATREIDYLSAGTKDIAYVSLRLALAELVYEKEKPPLVFDESFVRLDEVRLSRMLKMLTAASLSKRQAIDEGYQILIFTCHPREARILSDTQAKIIRL